MRGMTEQPSRKCRNVKRTLWSVVILFWLLSLYVVSFGVSEWMLSGRIIDQRTAFKIQSSWFFRPIHRYESTDLPGAEGLTTLSRWCIFTSQGTPLTWGQAAEGAKNFREMRRKDMELRRGRE
jgi:hypothetical protein